jgi:AcrR family transcriptional regulator
MSLNDINYTPGMGRWAPGAEGRLQEAAMALYVERGFEQTTVADIAERAGVTARTFFRYYGDKREVLFAGSAALQQEMVAALESAPAGTAPLDAVGAALDAAAALIGGNREHSRGRQAVITANDELRERELMKMARLSDALAAGLLVRGVPDARSRLAAEAGIAVFRVAFERWAGDEALPEGTGLAELLRDGMAELRTMTAG